MGVWESPVQGQKIEYQDRDQAKAQQQLAHSLDVTDPSPTQSEYHTNTLPATLPAHHGTTLVVKPEQLELFPEEKPRLKSKAEYEEIFRNLKVGITGRDNSFEHKQLTAASLLDIFKNGDRVMANYAKAVLLDLLVYGV